MTAEIIDMKKGRKVDAGLPEHPPELLDLPDKLGELQDYIHGRMAYPCRATAGFYSFVVMTMLLQTENTISSRDGLGFNEFYLGLAPTGFGKEEVRKVVGKVHYDTGLAERSGAVALHYAAPPSMQGIHELIQDSRSGFQSKKKGASFRLVANKSWVFSHRTPAQHVQHCSKISRTVKPI